MNAIDTLTLARALERLIVVVFGGTALILGWSLFKAHIVKDQAASLAGMKWSLKLQRVGPGIFFALFGTAVLLVALTRPLSLQTGSPTDASSPDPTAGADAKRLKAQFGFGNRDRGDQAAEADQALRALNTIRQSCLMPRAGGVPKNAQGLNRAAEWVDDQRTLAGRVVLGDYAQRYEELSKKAVDRPDIIQQLPDGDREKYFDADNRMQVTFTDGTK